MKILTEHKKLWDKNIEREVERNRNDADAEVQKAAKQLKQWFIIIIIKYT